MGPADLQAARGGRGTPPGPVAVAAKIRHFDEIVLLSDFSKGEAVEVQTALQARGRAEVTLAQEKLSSAFDYAQVAAATARVVGAVLAERGVGSRPTFLIAEGSSVRATVWVLLAPRYRADVVELRETGLVTVRVPVDLVTELGPLAVRQANDDLSRLQRAVAAPEPSFEQVVHRSDVMKRLIVRAKQAASYQVPLLLEGEAGTGKELLARAIHRSGPRGNRPPEVVRCGALVEGDVLAESKGGTLVFREVGALPWSLQGVLVSWLEAGRADAPRIIATTSRDLRALVQEGQFREDLYEHLAILVLKVPALRFREGDLGILIDKKLQRLNEDLARPAGPHKKVSPAGRELLIRHGWPGNVKELQNTLVRAFVWSKGTLLQEDDIRESLVTPVSSSDGGVLHRALGNGFRLEETMAEVARHYLGRALQEAEGNKTKAATLVGFSSYQTLTNWLRRYGVPLP